MLKNWCKTSAFSIINLFLLSLLLISKFDKILCDEYITLSQNKACEITYGSEWSSISYKGNEKPDIRCKELWCQKNTEIKKAIITDHLPLNDGISCGEYKTCYKGLCIDRYGPWEPVGNCSNGITDTIRQCTYPIQSFHDDICNGRTNGFAKCGTNKISTVLNNNLPMTRDEQCEIGNNNELKWTAVSHKFLYYDNSFKKDPCKLYCIDGRYVDDKYYYHYDTPVDFGTVMNGTECLNDNAHHCISGKCKHKSLVPYEKNRNVSTKTIPQLPENSRKLNLTNQGSLLTQYYSKPYYIRIGVFADWTMMDYYKENLTTYIEMMMKKVAEVYKHPSIGHSIEIILTDIVLITKEEGDSSFYNSGINMKFDFGEWIRKVQTHINNFDIPIFLSRSFMGSFWGKTEGNLCGPVSPAINVRDNGVATLYGLSHGIGQTLGMPNDFEEICEKRERKTVMADFETFEYPLTWSECSRKFISKCLSNNRTIHLLEKPKEYLRFNQKQLLGELFSIDKQCERSTEEKSIYYRESKDDFNIGCKSFRCIPLNDSFPIENITHALFDGTPCGPGKMCYDGDCVDKKIFPLQPIHGGWGDWKFGNCSTKCGPGIRKFTRDCDNPKPANGGEYCLGRKIKFVYCNIKECQNETIVSRKKQCSEFRNWTTTYYPHEIGNLTNLEDYGIAPDGTLCGNNSTDDMCINGECKQIGCSSDDDMDEYSTTEICDSSIKFCSVPDPATGLISNDSLCYEMLPKTWTESNRCIIINRIKQRWERIINFLDKKQSELSEVFNIIHKDILNFIYSITQLEIEAGQSLVDAPELIKKHLVKPDYKLKIVWDREAVYQAKNHCLESAINKYYNDINKKFPEYVFNYTLELNSIKKEFEDKFLSRKEKLSYFNRIEYSAYFCNNKLNENEKFVKLILTDEPAMIINKIEEFEESVYTLEDDVANEINLLKALEKEIRLFARYTYYINEQIRGIILAMGIQCP